MTYIRGPKAAKDSGYGLICTKATTKSYELVSQWEFKGKTENKEDNK